MTEDKLNRIEEKMEKKIDEFSALAMTVTKMDATLASGIEDMSEIKATINLHVKTSADAVQRIHQRIDETLTHVRGSIDDHKDRVVEVEKEFHKFKNIGYGLIIAGGIIFSLAQYIISITMHELYTKIAEMHQTDNELEAKVQNKWETNMKRLGQIETDIAVIKEDHKKAQLHEH